jgi:hypothetical protein
MGIPDKRGSTRAAFLIIAMFLALSAVVFGGFEIGMLLWGR